MEFDAERQEQSVDVRAETMAVTKGVTAVEELKQYERSIMVVKSPLSADYANRLRRSHTRFGGQ